MPDVMEEFREAGGSDDGPDGVVTDLMHFFFVEGDPLTHRTTLEGVNSSMVYHKNPLMTAYWEFKVDRMYCRVSSWSMLNAIGST